jgi:hypothetical protein
MSKRRVVNISSAQYIATYELLLPLALIASLSELCKPYIENVGLSSPLEKLMSKAIAWAVFVLGFVHIVFGIARFKAPLADAWSAGFIGQFATPEIRRTAFWFLMAGPLFAVVGHVAIHAVNVGDLKLLKILGTYMLVSSLVGVLAFPISPLWAPLALSVLLLATGYGVIQ